jgi:hypothetical protein
MGSLGDAVVEVRADLNPLSKNLGTAEGMVRKFTSGLGGSVVAGITTGLTTASVGLIASAGGALFDAARKAADLGETLSKVKTTFGADAAVVSDFADEMAKKFGLVRQETLDAAASIGLIGQAAGLSAGQSAQLSVSLAKLGADASSFYNVPLAEALQKIRSGLVGESEPLRAFGVLLSEDAVKAEALKSGLARSGEALSEQQKVVARAAIITRGLATASGDLERTQDSAANQMRKFTGDVENFKTEVGTALIPALTEAMKLAREFGSTLAKAGGDGDADAAGQWAKSWLGAVRLVNASFDPAKRKVAFDAAAKGQNGLQALADDLEGVRKPGDANDTRVDASGQHWAKDAEGLKRQIRERKAAADAAGPGAEAASPGGKVDAFGRNIGKDRADAAAVEEGRKQLRAKDAGAALAQLSRLPKELGATILGAIKAAPGLASDSGAKRLASEGTLRGALGLLAPFAPGASKLLNGGLGAAAAVSAAAVNAPERKTPGFRPSEVIGAEDYGRIGLNGALNGAKDKQLTELEKSNTLLDQVVKGVDRLAKQNPAPGAVLRGRK